MWREADEHGAHSGADTLDLCKGTVRDQGTAGKQRRGAGAQVEKPRFLVTFLQLPKKSTDAQLTMGLHANKTVKLEMALSKMHLIHLNITA